MGWPYEAGTFESEYKKADLKRKYKYDKKLLSDLELYPFTEDYIEDTQIDKVKGAWIVTLKGNRFSVIGRRGNRASFYLNEEYARIVDGVTNL